MKLLRNSGDTSQILEIFIADTRSASGAGLTGLTNASSGLVAYYHRDSGAGAGTAISLVSMTLGTFTSGGFKEIDATNMPGWYQFCPPDAAFATGAKSVAIHLQGAANMAPLPIEVQIDAPVVLSSSERNNAADAILARTLGTESYAAEGAVPTLAQILFMIWSGISQFDISSVTLTARKLDGTTAAMTFTLNSATAPTSRIRAT